MMVRVTEKKRGPREIVNRNNLLALHVTCARVAHMSGATKYFDRPVWEAEETKILALVDHLLTYSAIFDPLLLSSFEGLDDIFNHCCIVTYQNQV